VQKYSRVTLLFVFFLFTGCATLGYNPGREARVAFFQSEDWTSEDTHQLDAHVHFTITPYKFPYTWISKSNADIKYSIVGIKDYLRFGLCAKDVAITKENLKTGERTEVVFLAEQNHYRDQYGNIHPEPGYILHIR